MKVIKLQSCDGELFEVDQEIVSMCTTVKNMLRGKSAFRNSLGGQFSIDGILKIRNNYIFFNYFTYVHLLMWFW